MSITKNQFERRDLLIQLLRQKKLTKDELLQALTDRMCVKFGPHYSFSERTLADDLKYLRDVKGAEIHRPNKDDKWYYLMNQVESAVQFNDEEVDTLLRAVDILQAVQGISVSQELQRLLYKAQIGQLAEMPEQVIAFENHNLAEGYHYVNDVIEAVRSRSAVRIRYRAFTDQEEQQFDFSPYFVKQYRNRWYVYGLNHSTNSIFNLGFDRIRSLKPAKAEYVPNTRFNHEDFFRYLIGVTQPMGAAPLDIELRISKVSALYVESKKIISNQRILKRYANGDIRVGITAYNNYELRQNLLGFGAALTVLSPQRLADEMATVLKQALNNYTPAKH